MATAVEEAARVIQGVRVPSEHDFEQNASDFLAARDVEALAHDLIEKWPELSELVEVEIRFAWKREGGKTGEAGYCKKLSPEGRHLASADFFIWLAADHSRLLSQHQMEALVYHELCHAGLDEKGKPKAVKHDIELFYSEVRRYGAWHDGLEMARQTFEQMVLPFGN